MAHFYGIATNKKEDKTFRVDIQSTQRHLAYQEAVQQCAEHGLVLKDVYMAQGTKKGGTTNTKFNEYRKRNNGENPKEYNRSL